MITQKYNLNLIPNKVPVIVNASQYDKTSRTLKFNIYNDTELFTIPTGSTVTVRGTKPDKTGFEYSCSYSGSVVSVNIQQQMTVKSGKVPCEIRIVKGSEIIGTANFILDVEMTALADDTIISETDLPLLESAEQYAIRAETAAQQAEATVGNKMDKVSSPTANDILLTNSSGQAIDSGMGINDAVKMAFDSSNNILLSGVNLNDITSAGLYRVPANAANAPRTNAGTLEVLNYNDSIYVQIYTFNNGRNSERYIRYINGNTITPWRIMEESYVSGDTLTISNNDYTILSSFTGNSGNALFFVIPLSKKIAANSFTFTGMNLQAYSESGRFLTNENVISSNYSVSSTITYNGIAVSVTKTNGAFSVGANKPFTLYITGASGTFA